MSSQSSSPALPQLNISSVEVAYFGANKDEGEDEDKRK